MSLDALRDEILRRADSCGLSVLDVAPNRHREALVVSLRADARSSQSALIENLRETSPAIERVRLLKDRREAYGGRLVVLEVYPFLPGDCPGVDGGPLHLGAGAA